MKSLLLLPILVGGMFLTGCEVVELDRRPAAHHRYGYDRGDSYDRGRTDYYDDDPTYRTHSVYREGYYTRSRPASYSYGYEGTRSPYRSDGYRTQNSGVIHRTYSSNPSYYRAGVSTRGVSRSFVKASSKEKRHDKDDQKRKKKH